MILSAEEKAIRLNASFKAAARVDILQRKNMGELFLATNVDDPAQNTVIVKLLSKFRPCNHRPEAWVDFNGRLERAHIDLEKGKALIGGNWRSTMGKAYQKTMENVFKLPM